MKTIKNKFYCIALLMILPFSSMAIDKETVSVASSDPMSGHYLLQLIMGLVVVLVCIVVLAWLAKRVNRLHSSTAGVMKIVGGLSMGAREKIVLLQVGNEQLLIGVAPGRINTLHVLDKPVEGTEHKHDENGEERFSEKLKSIISENTNG